MPPISDTVFSAISTHTPDTERRRIRTTDSLHIRIQNSKRETKKQVAQLWQRDRARRF